MIHEASPAQKVKLLKLLKEYNVRQTKKFIQRAHDEEQGQTYGTLPYSSHPKQVARIGKKFFGSEFGEDARKVALLHDILEDTPYTAQQLAKKGFSKEVIQAVQLLTKNKALSYADNISAIIDSGNKLAMMVKYADNYVNYTGDKSDWAPEKAALSQKKYMDSLNRLGDVLGVKKHLEAQTNVTENADYLSEK
jgi:(p)ppGpp synthase/HD superfamily hydrolase